MSAPRSVGRRHGWCGGVAAAPARARGGAGALPLAWPRRRPEPNAGSREFVARLQGGSRASISSPARSLAASRGGEVQAIEPSRWRVAREHPAWRANTPPARGHSGVAGESHPRLLDEIGEALLVVLLREWRPARAVRAAARRAWHDRPLRRTSCPTPRRARAAPMLDIKLPHGRALLLSAANLVLLDQSRRSADYVETERCLTIFFSFAGTRANTHRPVVLGGTETPRGWCLLPSVKPPFLFSSSPPLRRSPPRRTRLPHRPRRRPPLCRPPP